MDIGARWGYDAARHRLPSQVFRTISVSPDTQNQKAARLRRGRKLEVLLSERALLSTLTAGLPTLRKIGNPSFQPLFLHRDRSMEPYLLRKRPFCQEAVVAAWHLGSELLPQ